MITKLFEIRDRLTFVPALAIQLDSPTEAERYLLSRAGFGNKDVGLWNYIVLWPMHLDFHVATTDPGYWDDRTYQTAHYHIMENWDSLKSGDVIDVEFILGGTTEPKKSERITTGATDV